MKRLLVLILTLAIPVISITSALPFQATPDRQSGPVPIEVPGPPGPQRPRHEGMLNVEDIKAGMFLYMIGKGYKYEILVIREPYTDGAGKCRFDSLYWSDDSQAGVVQNMYCADEGLVEYSGIFKGWNAYNYLVTSERVPLSAEELDSVKSALFEWRLRLDPRVHNG